jgi:hypothetical protein
MRAWEDLCAFAEIYERSRRFMSVRGDLCALQEIYELSRRILSAIGVSPSLTETHTRKNHEYKPTAILQKTKTSPSNVGWFYKLHIKHFRLKLFQFQALADSSHCRLFC